MLWVHTHLMPKEKCTSAGLLRAHGMCPSRLGPKQAAVWFDSWVKDIDASERSLTPNFSWQRMSECLPCACSPCVNNLAKGLTQTPSKGIPEGRSDTPRELTSRFLEAEGDEFNSPVREAHLPTSRKIRRWKDLPKHPQRMSQHLILTKYKKHWCQLTTVLDTHTHNLLFCTTIPWRSQRHPSEWGRRRKKIKKLSTPLSFSVVKKKNVKLR